MRKSSGSSIEDMKIMLLPKDPNDEKNVILEIRAGIGGDEAALFGADLLRMYQRYAERHGYKMEYMNENTNRGRGRKGSGAEHHRQGRLFAAQVRKRRSPGAACAGDGIPGAHTHQRGHGGGNAGG